MLTHTHTHKRAHVIITFISIYLCMFLGHNEPDFSNLFENALFVFVKNKEERILFTFVSFRFCVNLFPIEIDAVASWNESCERKFGLAKNSIQNGTAQCNCLLKYCVYPVHCVFVCVACTLITRFCQDTQMQSSFNWPKMYKILYIELKKTIFQYVPSNVCILMFYFLSFQFDPFIVLLVTWFSSTLSTTTHMNENHYYIIKKMRERKL